MRLISTALLLWMCSSLLIFGSTSGEVSVISGGKKHDVLGVDIFYSLSGTSQSCIVLLHGFGASCYSWNRVFDTVAGFATVIAYDRPFFGFSERITEIVEERGNPYSLISQDDILFELLDELAIDNRPLILIGHSAGAAVALQAYFEKPECVDALILVAPSISYSQYDVRALPFPFETIASLSPFIKKYLINQMQEAVKLAWYDSSLYTEIDRYYYAKPFETDDWEKALPLYLLSQEPYDFSERLNEIAVPTLYISGKEDKIIPLTLTHSFYIQTPNAELSVIPYCGHIPQEEKPAAFIDCVTDFLYRRSLTKIP